MEPLQGSGLEISQAHLASRLCPIHNCTDSTQIDESDATDDRRRTEDAAARFAAAMAANKPRVERKSRYFADKLLLRCK